MRYSILDPTGNITALVEDAVEPCCQPQVAKDILQRHPEVEQVGFADFSSGVSLRMAGGEFCGNATMSAAALYAMRDGLQTPATVKTTVSGVSGQVEVQLFQESKELFSAKVRMPPALSLEQVTLRHRDLEDKVVVVRLEGISHAIIEAESPLFLLLNNKDEAEQAIRAWCQQLMADGLGLMFLSKEHGATVLTPLVFIPGSDTVYWENSCASGSAATGMYHAWKEARAIDVLMKEPGGTLRVTSDPTADETWLYGSVRLVGEYAIG